MGLRLNSLAVLLMAAMLAGCAWAGDEETPLERSARAYFGPDHKGRIAVVLEGPLEEVDCRRATLSTRERTDLADPKALLFGCKVRFQRGGTQLWRLHRDRWGLTGRPCRRLITRGIGGYGPAIQLPAESACQAARRIDP